MVSGTKLTLMEGFIFIFIFFSWYVFAFVVFYLLVTMQMTLLY